MTKIIGIVLLVISAVTFVCGMVFRNEVLYRKFFKRYAQFFGIDITKIPSTSAVPDPILPHVKQAKIAGYMFIGLAVWIFLTALYLLNVST